MTPGNGGTNVVVVVDVVVLVVVGPPNPINGSVHGQFIRSDGDGVTMVGL